MLNNKKGISMIVVISVILSLVILGGAAALISFGHFGISYTQRRHLQAQYVAEAAMQRTLWELRTGQIIPPVVGNPPLTVPFAFTINDIPAGNVTIQIEDENQAGQNPVGVHPITITVNY